MVKDRRITVNGDHNISGYNISNVGNVTNIMVSHPVGANDPLERLKSKVAFGALLNSEERYPAPYCHPNTRVAARKVVKNWIARKGHGSEKSIMWISGGPGVGKSALLQTVCVCDSGLRGEDESDLMDFEDDNSLIVACHFFGRGMGDREKASFFPATIAYQLVHSRASWADTIEGILAKKPSILLESLPSQFRKLLLRPAKAHAASETPVTIVIDALDECDSVRDQVRLLDDVFEAAVTANMRFVIASRPEEDIHAFFERSNVSRHTYHIRLDNDFEASRDIEIFLCAKFADIRQRRAVLCPRLSNGEEWPGSIVIYRLRDESDGQFIYPTLVIAFIDTPYFSPDQQLKTLLAAPPARAFSKLDALYRQILTRAPPEFPTGCDELLDFQRLVMGILRVVIFWPDLLTAAKIARVLDKEVSAVQAIVLGPMCSLFKTDSTNLDWAIITLCHKSLRDYLLDRLRSQDFFFPTDSLDRLYIEVLSRQPPCDTSQSYSRKVLMDVLRVVAALGGWLKLSEIASFLDAPSGVVEGVIFGPARAIFKVYLNETIHFSTPQFKGLLLDPRRAGEFFVPSGEPDILFTQVLSRQPPSNSSLSYSREVLIGVLRVIAALGGWLKLPEIASFLDAPLSVVEGAVFGPARAVFYVSFDGIVHFSTAQFKGFLLDPGRAGEFFVPSDEPGILFTQVLSRQPPSDSSLSYSREVLMGVLRVIGALDGLLTLPEIASFLDVPLSVVERVIFGPAWAIFEVSSDGMVHFSTLPFKEFVLDARRAGEFFVPSDGPDILFTQILSRQPPPDSSQSYSRKELATVLTAVQAQGGRGDVSKIAAMLDVAPSFVEGVIFGPAKALFRLDFSGKIGFSSSHFEDFLLDASRAGEYFIQK